nr:immunoglobulin heavy chain junction region [Macaca mulatta]MOY24057.1 immunoglobulin heavy chain junction region [Macaca mulatta]MOY24253.1 immunoglobulin heavy chain junction region [Macaca mulatta]MOY26670.1 immunoglobulin heavy chain junction region [Macaca mulatta]MOY27302.1 immunoglobulin heavy chain junction region [Macaca mulatta]
CARDRGQLALGNSRFDVW